MIIAFLQREKNLVTSGKNEFYKVHGEYYIDTRKSSIIVMINMYNQKNDKVFV